MSSAELMTIEGNLRTGLGKSYTRKARKAGKVPAVLNGQGKSTLLEINPKWLSKAWLNGKVFNLVMDGKTSAVKITELQIDSVKRVPLHVDLAYVK